MYGSVSNTTPGGRTGFVLRNGLIYDGSGHPPRQGDVWIDGSTIMPASGGGVARAATEVDVDGLAVAPGFINVLSWATESLIEDGASQSDIRQGVTLEVFGEGMSMGPLTPAMQREMLERQGDIRYPVTWSTLADYLEWLVQRGVSTNVASFIGATTVRINVVGYADRRATEDELGRMCELVREAMREGALGVGSSLIYAPAFYADSAELTALARAAGERDGLYISHIRGEGRTLLESLDELIEIARQANVAAEIYHLKALGQQNWDKLDAAIARVEQARAEGLAITADMYTYPASSTGLDAVMPPWVQEGGHRAWVDRLKNPVIREQVKLAMATPSVAWENNYVAAGSADNIMLVGFKTNRLKPLAGLRLSQVAGRRGTSPMDTAIDLVIEDDSRVGAVYFVMSEDNIRKQITLPWMSFGSDGPSLAPTGAFLNTHPHPRAYGTFARLLGRYVRDERLIPLEEAVRRLTSLPAHNLGLERRGSLKPGYFADVVVFDPSSVQDHATFAEPHQYATGVRYVFVNGEAVLWDGEHTGAMPGRVVRRSEQRSTS
jgi:N-acyl-D-amino-acid deacylase